MIAKVKTAWQTARDYGLAWTLRRLYYEAQLRTGHHKRKLPKRDWQAPELGQWLKKDIALGEVLEHWRKAKRQFFFDLSDREKLQTAIEAINPNALDSLYLDPQKQRYFSKLEYSLTFPQAWFTNPFLSPSVQCEPDKHWSEYPMHTEAYEDLKFVWESGRFAIVYDWVRAYALTGDESLAERYWQHIESWIENNPPNTGPHWKCGQETSLRLMAWYVGWFAFKDCPATTSERFEKWLGAIAAQAYRVSQDYHYSYLQQSNHAVSEGLGLYVTGLLFPQLKDAEQWREMGKKILEERVTFLIRRDGTYFQKSHNYLRFMVQIYLYVIRFGEANNDHFSKTVKQRLRACLDYLTAIVDPQSGRSPNFGSNDGALILPFNSCDFADYRPTLCALHYYFHKELLGEKGPWLEDSLWLFGADSLSPNASLRPEPHHSQRFDHSGIYTLGSAKSWGFVHAESYRDRPAHADALHLDLWWRGINICCDPGTYLYYGRRPWLDAYKHTRYHNTITVDGKDQMERGYRFTWGYWHQCQVNAYQGTGAVLHMEFEHDGYTRLTDSVIHRRAIARVAEEYWVVVDDIIGEESHEIELHWLLADFPVKRKEEQWLLETPQGDFAIGHYTEVEPLEEGKMVRGDSKKEVDGWRSNYYGFLEKALSLRFNYRQKLPLRLVTCLGPEGWEYQSKNVQTGLELQTPQGAWQFQLNQIGKQQIFQDITKSKHEN